jgi:D-lactate dehydrogenase (cytochrome)
MNTMVERDPDIVRSFLSDAAHMPGGEASGVVFPRTTGELAAYLLAAPHVLAIGAQSSLTGGATPRGDLVLSTREFTDISLEGEFVHVGAGVTLHALQAWLSVRGLWYPPAPTFDGAFVGGTIATNAAGAATFKYGTTRQWVEGLEVVLADGTVHRISRGDVIARGFTFEVPSAHGILSVPVPRYSMPRVPKLSAGYWAHEQMDLVDLFVGSEGTLGVITAATLRVRPRPRQMVALITCVSDSQALRITSSLRTQAQDTWRGHGVLDVAAIEYMDGRSLGFVSDAVLTAAGVSRPPRDGSLLLVQLEVDTDEGPSVEALATLIEQESVTQEPAVALPGDLSAAGRMFALREAVPSGVNAAVAAHKARYPNVHKLAGDFIVPYDQLPASIAHYRAAFESRGLDYAIWGHISDGNLHPNVIPHAPADLNAGTEALLELSRRVIAAGGSPMAEHGVGRSALKQRMLRDLYGDAGLDEMRAVKRALDPTFKLARGVLFS